MTTPDRDALAAKIITRLGLSHHLAWQVANAVIEAGWRLPTEPTIKAYRPCAGCDAITDSCRSTRCPAVNTAPNTQEPNKGSMNGPKEK